MKLAVQIVTSAFIVSALVQLASCSSGAKTSPNVSSHNPVSQPTNFSNIATKQEKIKFKKENGEELFSLKTESDGAKIVDSKNNELVRLKVEQPEKVKFKDAGEKVLGYIVTKNDYWKIENPDQTKELYILRRQNDGDYKLEDGANKEIYRIKARGSDFDIETPTKHPLYNVKVKEGKTSLKDASNKIVLSTKYKVRPIAIACFGFDVLSREQKAALAYAVNLTGGK